MPVSSTRYLPGWAPGIGLTTRQTLYVLPSARPGSRSASAGSAWTVGRYSARWVTTVLASLREQERQADDDRRASGRRPGSRSAGPGGSPPTRKPVLRSCEVVPPLEAAMQTIAGDRERGQRGTRGPTQPSRTKIRQVSSSVATVMPEIGFDDEPISPVSREETVTNRKPNSDDHRRADDPAGEVGRDQVRRGDRRDQRRRAEADEPERQVALGPARRRRRRLRRRRRAGRGGPSRSTRGSAAGPGTC